MRRAVPLVIEAPRPSDVLRAALAWSLAAATACAVAALPHALGAQVQSAPRFVATASVALVPVAVAPAAPLPTAPSPATWPAAALAAVDSARAHRMAAVGGRRRGAALVGAGLGAIAAAYVGYARGGGMGMRGSQLALAGAGSAAALLGATGLGRAREHEAAARAWAMREATALP